MTTPPDDIMDTLAAYALGALAPDEIARVEALLAAQPELRAQLAELRATADALPYGLPDAQPAADLRQRTLDYATGRASRRTARTGDGLAARARGWIMALATLAAVALVAAAIGWAQVIGANNDARRLRGEIAAAQAQLGQLQQQISAANKVLASLASAAGQAALLQTNAGAAVFVARLPALPPGRVYQLWRIQGTNAPASAGLFTVSPQGFGQAELPGGQPPAAGEIIAVTDEPAGGSPGPTTQPIISATINA